MADIDITVDKKGLFQIQLDKWEWTSLTVNNTTVEQQHGAVQFSWSQSHPGAHVHFIATANKNVVIENPGNFMYLKSADSKSTYVAVISYATTEQEVTLHGMLVDLAFAFAGAQTGPILFSQGRMTGKFALASK